MNSTTNTHNLKPCKTCGDDVFRGDLCLPCSMAQTVNAYCETEYGKQELARENETRKQSVKASNQRVQEQRKAQQSILPNDFNKQDRERAFDYFNGRCAVCERPLRDLFGEHTQSTDHWIPLSDPREDNPGTTVGNMIPLCYGVGGCNNKKYNSDPVDWLVFEYGEPKASEILARIESYFKWAKLQKIDD